MEAVISSRARAATEGFEVFCARISDGDPQVTDRITEWDADWSAITVKLQPQQFSMSRRGMTRWRQGRCQAAQQRPVCRMAADGQVCSQSGRNFRRPRARTLSDGCG